MIRSLTLAVLVLTSCGAFTVIDLNHYTTTCTAPSDCVGVHLGGQCAACDCPTGAINKSSLEQFQRDRAAVRRSCIHFDDPACSCAPQEPQCNAGTCALQ